MAAKKHRKAPSAAAAVAAAPVSPPAAAPARDRLVPIAYGAFLFALLFACYPDLDSKFALPKLAMLAAGTAGLSALLLVRAWRGRIAPPGRTPLLLALALGAWWIATTPFALHLPTALDGEYDHYNGLWTHLCCLLLFIASATLPSAAATRKITLSLVAVTALVAVVNLLDATGAIHVGLREVSTLGDRVAAAAAMNFAVPFVALALLGARRWSMRAALAGLLALLLVSEFLSQGRGPWLGLVVAAAILVVGRVRAAARWKALAALVVVVAALAGVAAKLDPVVAQRFASLAHVTQDEALNQRFMYYRAALRIVGDHPLAGIGFENFRNAYPAYRAEDVYFFRNIIPTMVHNGYLETAVNNGVPALLLYLALVATVLWRLARQPAGEAPPERDLRLALLAALGAYLVQDLTGWLNLGLAPLFWIVLGLAAREVQRTAPGATLAHGKAILAAVCVPMIVLGAWLLSDSHARLQADARLFRAQALDVGARWREAAALADGALAALPGDARTEATAAHIYASRFVAARDADAYARAHELLEAAWRHNPFERMRLVNLVALEGTALATGRIRAPTAFAQDGLTALMKTDGGNPGFHVFRAQFLAAQGRFGDALAAVREARRLAPQDVQLQALEAEYAGQVSGQR